MRAEEEGTKGGLTNEEKSLETPKKRKDGLGGRGHRRHVGYTPGPDEKGVES